MKKDTYLVSFLSIKKELKVRMDIGDQFYNCFRDQNSNELVVTVGRKIEPIKAIENKSFFMS